MAGRVTERLFLCGLPAVITWALLVQRVSYGEEDVDRTVKALEAAFDTWVSKLEFVCTFEQSTTVADTFENALQEKYLSPPQWQVRGEYAMADKLIRHAITAVRQEPKPAQNLKGRIPVHFEVHQYARNVRTGVFLSWRPGNVVFMPLRLNSASADEDLAPSEKMMMVLSPLLLQSGPGGQNNPIRALRIPDVPPDKQRKMKWVVDRPNPDVIELRFIPEDVKSGGSETHFVFAIKRGIPLIIREEFYLLQQDGEKQLALATSLEDFVSVRGGEMASKVRRLLRLADGRVSVTIWKSGDLGRRRPQPSDFLVVVPGGDSVDCVRSSSIPHVVSGKRSFDISKMSPDDFDPSCLAGASKFAATGRAARGPSWLFHWWLWIAVAVVSVTLVGYITYRLRRK